MGAGRLRWWSSGESRSDLNLRLHEQWQKEQGEKGFLPQSERWPTIRSDDLSFGPAYDLHHAQLAIQASCRFCGGTGKCLLPDVAEPVLIDCECRPGFKAGSAKALLEAYDAEVSRGGWCNEESGSHPSRAHGLMPKNEIPVGLRDRPTLVGVNLTIVSCRLIPPHTGYIFQGEFNCALCAEEKAMNRIEYNSPLGWSVGVVRDLNSSADQIEVVAKAGGRKYSFPFVINLSRPAIGELEEALQYVAGKGFEPHEVRASQYVFIQLEKFMDDMRTASSLAAIINAPPPTVAGRVDLAEHYLKEKHIGLAEYLGILDTGRLPEEKEAVTLTSPTGDKVTLHVPKEQPMSSITTQERHEKEYGPAKPIGPDIVCACCGKSAPRKFGCAPDELRYGLVPDDDGWMIWVFPLARLLEPSIEREMTKLCPPCAKEVAEHVAYLKTKKSGDAFGLSDEDLLADDA